MITMKQIIEQYFKSIPKKIRQQINAWIADPEPQKYIHKALAYKLTDEDCRYLFSIGSQKSKYLRLYYLCCIYIHPLTVMQHITETY